MYSVLSLDLFITQCGMTKDGEDGEPEIFKDVRASIRESVLSSFRSPCGRPGRQAVDLLRVWPDSCSAMELCLAIHDPLPAIVGLITIHRVFHVLCENAGEAIAGRCEPSTVDLTAHPSEDGKSVRVSLRNPREDWPKIFAPLFTTKRTRSTGLGLWIVYHAMKNSGRRVDVLREPDKGAGSF